MNVLDSKKELRKVAVIGFCLVVAVFSGCKDNNGSGNSNGSSSGNTGIPGKPLTRVIKAAELLSKADAQTILGQSIISEKEEDKIYRNVIWYESKDFTIDLELYQKALYGEEDEEGDYARWLRDMERAISGYQGLIKIDGIERVAYRQKGMGLNQWLMYVFYGDYYINICIGSNPESLSDIGYTDTEEETAWKQAKLTQTAKLAVEHLKEILKKG